MLDKNILYAVNTIPWFALFVVGLTIGSFLNVCIYRIPKKKSLVWPGSFCTNCKTSIKWYDNVPVFSYMLLLGRCRSCKTKISLRYPLVELLTGYVFVHLYIFAQYRHESIYVYVSYLILCCLLIISTFVDFDLFIIPNEVTYLGIPLALAISVMFPDLHYAQNTLRDFSLIGIPRLDALIASFSGMIAGGGLIYLCGFFGKLLLRKEAMGFGDVKLMCMVGGFVGWKLAVAIFFVAPFFGLIMAIPVLILKKNRMVPYGPFLSIATLACILMQDYFIGYANLYIRFFSILFKPGFL